MSKSSVPSEPICFLQLDLMTNFLLHDTNELQIEFTNKVDFIKEQDRRCLENGNDLVCIDQYVQDIKLRTLRLEMEIKETDLKITEAERRLERLEQSSNKEQSVYIENTPRLELLKMLTSAESSAAKHDALNKEMEQYNTEINERLAAYDSFTKLLNIDNVLLEALERKILQLESKKNSVACVFDHMDQSKSKQI